MTRTTVLLLATLTLCGCGRDLPRREAPAPRTVSFTPAITEMLFSMGLGDHVVGVTTYCKPPAGVDIPVVGSELNIAAEPILAVAPDVLITQTDLKRFETLARLAPGIRIEHIRIETLEDIADALARIANLMGAPHKGAKARSDFLEAIGKVRRRVAGRPKPRVIFVMGHHAPSTAGRATFINELIEVAGGVNIAAEKYQGWRNIGIESLLKLAPDVIVCESDASAADDARKYWSELMADSPNKVRVYVVTDKRWTIPAGSIAHVFAPKMADFIHPEAARGAAK